MRAFEGRSGNDILKHRCRSDNLWRWRADRFGEPFPLRAKTPRDQQSPGTLRKLVTSLTETTASCSICCTARCASGGRRPGSWAARLGRGSSSSLPWAPQSPLSPHFPSCAGDSHPEASDQRPLRPQATGITQQKTPHCDVHGLFCILLRAPKRAAVLVAPMFLELL